MHSKITCIQDVIKQNLCISCGACVSAAPVNTIELRYDHKYDMYIPVIIQPNLVDGRGDEFIVCPGKGVDLIRLSKTVSKNVETNDSYLGYIDGVWAAHSNNVGILENASSGGIMTEIASFLLSSGRVNGIITTKLDYNEKGPVPKTIIAKSIDELIECQGSKYLPVASDAILGLLPSYQGTVAFIGTPCQIEGLRMLQERNDMLRNKVRYVIGNFCGGIRNFKAMYTTIERQGIKPSNVIRFRFRGGGQPGSMMIEDSFGRIVHRPYPEFEKDTGYKKIERCRLCIDGTAELADFACGDAWNFRDFYPVITLGHY